jgi:hypothetical protein
MACQCWPAVAGVGSEVDEPGRRIGSVARRPLRRNTVRVIRQKPAVAQSVPCTERFFAGGRSKSPCQRQNLVLVIGWHASRSIGRRNWTRFVLHTAAAVMRRQMKQRLEVNFAAALACWVVIQRLPATETPRQTFRPARLGVSAGSAQGSDGEPQRRAPWAPSGIGPAFCKAADPASGATPKPRSDEEPRSSRRRGEVVALMTTVEKLFPEPSEAWLRRRCGDLQDPRDKPPVGDRVPAQQDGASRRALPRRSGPGFGPRGSEAPS